jgi:hypothetical protein
MFGFVYCQRETHANANTQERKSAQQQRSKTLDEDADIHTAREMDKIKAPQGHTIF